MTEQTEATVTRRRVFYIPGFDPHPPRRYRELYRTEAERQARVSGYRIAVAAEKGRASAWEAAAEIDGHRTHAKFDVLEWSDIVRGSMDRSIPSTYLQLLRVVWIYVSSGALRRLMWLRKGPIVAGFYPVLMLLGQLLLALLAGKLAAAIVTGGLSRVLDGVGRLFGAPELSGSAVWNWVDWLLGWGLFGAVTAMVLIWFKRQDGRLYAHYLMHDFAYTASQAGAWPDALETRIALFSERIAQALSEPVDEVLVVGHSSGAQLAISAVAGLVRQGWVSTRAPRLSVLTLGHSVPMMSFLPKAEDLRRDLHDLAASGDITWIDVSAPSDGCSFALCDPVAVTGVAPDHQRWPVVLSAAFSQTLSEKLQKELRHRYFRLHFQYLCAFDRPGLYDYFAITAGPRTLADRFAGKASSGNRIDVPASGYRSMAA